MLSLHGITFIQSAAVYTAHEDPYEDPPRTKQSDDTVQAMSWLVIPH